MRRENKIDTPLCLRASVRDKLNEDFNHAGAGNLALLDARPWGLVEQVKIHPDLKNEAGECVYKGEDCN